jgi:hypothetical protein
MNRGQILAMQHSPPRPTTRGRGSSRQTALGDDPLEAFVPSEQPNPDLERRWARPGSNHLEPPCAPHHARAEVHRHNEPRDRAVDGGAEASIRGRYAPLTTAKGPGFSRTFSEVAAAGYGQISPTT